MSKQKEGIVSLSSKQDQECELSLISFHLHQRSLSPVRLRRARQSQETPCQDKPVPTKRCNDFNNEHRSYKIALCIYSIMFILFLWTSIYYELQNMQTIMCECVTTNRSNTNLYSRTKQLNVSVEWTKYA